MGPDSGYLFNDFRPRIGWKFSDFRIPALSLLNRICFLGAKFLMTSHQSCWQVMRQRLCQEFVPHFGVQKVAYFVKMTHSYSKPSSYLHDFSNHLWELQYTLLNFAQAVSSWKAGKQRGGIICREIHRSADSRAAESTHQGTGNTNQCLSQ